MSSQKAQDTEPGEDAGERSKIEIFSAEKGCHGRSVSLALLTRQLNCDDKLDFLLELAFQH